MAAARQPRERTARAGAAVTNAKERRDGAGRDSPGDVPPPLGSWARLDALVIAALVLDILFLAWLTRRFH